MIWYKSQYSDSGGCVELADVDELTFIRDSKCPVSDSVPSESLIRIPTVEWEDFLGAIRSGVIYPSSGDVRAFKTMNGVELKDVEEDRSLHYNDDEWHAFVQGVQFDRLDKFCHNLEIG